MGENVMPLFVHGIDHTYLAMFTWFLYDFLQSLKTHNTFSILSFLSKKK